ncbi:MAG: hypothetical protein ACOCQ3_00480 [Natronomonas sp.]
MNRRSVFRSISVGVVFVAGCLGDRNGGGFDSDSDGSGVDQETGDDDEAGDGGDEEGVEHVTESFEARGFDLLEATQDGDTIVVEVQTTGDGDEDVRLAASAYATVAGEVERDLLVTVEDRGLREGSFEIQREWASGFADERISDQEYLDKIEETRR